MIKYFNIFLVNFFKQHKKDFFLGFAAIGFFAFGLLIGLEMHNFFIKQELILDQVIIREHETEFKLISPLLVLGDSLALERFSLLDNKLSVFINDLKNTHKIDDVSVYFRDLNGGRWMGINEKEEYAPASMYKVAVMIAVLKAAEGNSSLLSKQIAYDINPQDRAVPAEITAPRIELGKLYTVKELIARMIIYSDNDALAMLKGIINFDDEKKIFDDLELVMPLINDKGDTMSPELISRFFRVLYNAAYLPRSTSEFALDILSKTDFKEGLVAGVPLNITVAHKYGYRTSANDKKSYNELHDCGIIYHPSRPYFICVMTKGQDLQNLKNVIKQISSIVYNEVDVGNK